MHNQTFDFERDFVASLRCVPMAVRRKLDQVRIKLTLRQWSRLSREVREELLGLPCASNLEAESYRRRLIEVVEAVSQAPLQDLSEEKAIPDPCVDEPPTQIADFARSQGLGPIDRGAWRKLSDLQRFALVKLSRDNHDNVNFVPALREFGLLSAMCGRAASPDRRRAS